MFAERIEIPVLKPGPALRKRKLTNLLSRIKIGMFGVESLKPEYVVGKDVRKLNTRLVEELMRRMLSQRWSLIEKVYQSNLNPLRFYVLLKDESQDAMLCVHSLIGDYELLELMERYRVSFGFVRKDMQAEFMSHQFHEFNLLNNVKAC